jgi:hypothetical protein
MGEMKRNRRRFSAMRYRKDDPTHNLLCAANRYIRAHGGNLVIIGPIEIQDFGDGMGKFKLTVGCLGKKPVKKEANSGV